MGWEVAWMGWDIASWRGQRAYAFSVCPWMKWMRCSGLFASTGDAAVDCVMTWPNLLVTKRDVPYDP